jgi:hypothetical protein
MREVEAICTILQQRRSRNSHSRESLAKVISLTNEKTCTEPTGSLVPATWTYVRVGL